MTIFDTDTVTLLAYGRNEKLNRRVEALDASEPLGVVVVTWMEILQGRFAGLLKAANEQELATAMQRFRASREHLGQFEVLEVNVDAAQRFEQLRGQKKLKKMGRADLLIACIALAHEALLVTRNTAHFKPVVGLRVENWAD